MLILIRKGIMNDFNVCQIVMQSIGQTCCRVVIVKKSWPPLLKDPNKFLKYNIYNLKKEKYFLNHNFYSIFKIKSIFL